MSNTAIIVALVVLALVLFVSRIGYKRLTREKQLTDDAMKIAYDTYGDELDLLSLVSFHGGFGDKEPIKMHLALTDKGLVMFDEFGFMQAVPCSRWKEQDAFIACQKNNSAFKSVVLLGPWATTVFKDKYRHVITLDYLDEHDKLETLIIEAPDFNMFNKIQTALRTHKEDYLARYRKPSTKQSSAAKDRQERLAEREKERKREKLKASIENPV